MTDTTGISLTLPKQNDLKLAGVEDNKSQRISVPAKLVQNNALPDPANCSYCQPSLPPQPFLDALTKAFGQHLSRVEPEASQELIIFIAASVARLISPMRTPGGEAREGAETEIRELEENVSRWVGRFKQTINLLPWNDLEDFLNAKNQEGEIQQYKRNWESLVESWIRKDPFKRVPASKLPAAQVMLGLSKLLGQAFVELVVQKADPIPKTTLQIADPEEQELGRDYLQVPHTDYLKTRSYLALPSFIDLSGWCTHPVSEQPSEPPDACAAYAGTALMEYFQNKATPNQPGTASFKAFAASKAFLYKATNDLSEEGFGASIQATMSALLKVGVLPEEAWPSTVENFRSEASPAVIEQAQNYKAEAYFRLDRPTLSKEELLAQIKVSLAAGCPCLFGVRLHDSVPESSRATGYLLYPDSTLELAKDKGHALLAVGYDDAKQIGKTSLGALLVRNSWGEDWGVKGYGWLPYDYVLKNWRGETLTADWWSFLKTDWIESKQFELTSFLDWTKHIGWPFQ